MDDYSSAQKCRICLNDSKLKQKNEQNILLPPNEVETALLGMRDFCS